MQIEVIMLFVFNLLLGAVTPVYAALLPINVGKPQGEFLKKKNDPRMGRDVNKITCFRS